MKTPAGTSWRIWIGVSLALCLGPPLPLVAGIKDGLVGYWSLDETNGIVAVDSSGQGHYGVLCRFDGNNLQWTGGQVGGALQLAGPASGEYGRVASCAKATSTLSGSAWIYADGQPATSAAILNNWAETQPGQFDFGLLGAASQLGARIQLQSGASVSVFDTAPLPLGIWQHVAFVADGDHMHLYRNGIEVGTSQTYSGPILSNSPVRALGLGVRLNDTGTGPATSLPGFWKGRLDELALWTRALTAAEILAIYRGGLSGLGALTLPPNSSIRILAINNMGALQFRISFEDLIGAAGAYRLQSRPDLSAGADWAVVSNAQFSFSAGQFHLLTSGSSSGARFYRVAAVGDQDTDGDGLTDVQEVALGTNPLVADTDDDGYSDGLELAQGTDPLNSTNRLARAQQPEVTFAEPTSTTHEAVGTYWVPVTFSQRCVGQLRYSVSVLSTASNRVDFFDPQGGLLPVNGTEAAIPLAVVDDLEVENIEAIVLELQEDPLGAYHTGANPTHSVLVFDNDADWSGVLRCASGESSFRLRLLRNATQNSASLIPSTKSATNHLGGQIIPPPPTGQTGWPVSNLVLTSDHFEAVSPALPMGSSRMLAGVPLTRTLAFSAIPPPAGDTNAFYFFKTNALTGPLAIAGDYTEAVTPSSPGMAYLQFTNRGIFVLTREAAVMTPMQIPTRPAP